MIRRTLRTYTPASRYTIREKNVINNRNAAITSSYTDVVIRYTSVVYYLYYYYSDAEKEFNKASRVLGGYNIIIYT